MIEVKEDNIVKKLAKVDFHIHSIASVKDMINKVIFSLDINGDSLIIKVDDKKSKTISLKNKNINTMEIYNMLKYDKSNEYILNSSKIPDEEINGKDQWIKRLYNYTYDLLSQIIDAVNDENKRIAKEEKELSKKS